MSLGVIVTRVSWPGGSPPSSHKHLPITERATKIWRSYSSGHPASYRRSCSHHTRTHCCPICHDCDCYLSPFPTSTQGSSILHNPIDCRLLGAKRPSQPPLPRRQQFLRRKSSRWTTSQSPFPSSLSTTRIPTPTTTHGRHAATGREVTKRCTQEKGPSWRQPGHGKRRRSHRSGHRS